jgi:Putative auto-transporter adhesin, head GIN domain
MKSLIGFIFLMWSNIVFAQTKFVVDPNATIRELTGSFNSIIVSSAIHVYLTKGETESLALSTANPNNTQNIKTVLENGVLKIYYKSDDNKYGYDKKANVYLSYKSLSQITISDASNLLIADTLIAPSLSIKLSDASVIKGPIQTTNLSIKISDASVAKLSGVASNVNVQCSDASSFNAYELIADNAIVKASDASNINITVKNEITARASDASNINFKGSATIIEKHSSDASNISKVN